jgi:hypothetical protein
LSRCEHAQTFRQGNAKYVYYALAAQQLNRRSVSACDASKLNGDLPSKTCIFHAITRGDMDIPCRQNPDTGKFYDCFGAPGSTIIGELSTSNSKNDPAYPATSGYDLATGLGSVEATNLFSAWPH